MIVLRVEILNLPQFARVYNHAVREMGGACYKAVKLGCQEGVAEMLAVRRWKDRTGATRAATRGYVTEHLGDEGAKGVMECASDNASRLDSGTTPHQIWPKEGQKFIGALRPNQGRRTKGDIGTHRVALRWYDGGGNPVFRSHVNHRGTRGDGFFGKGVQKCERVMVREIELGVPRAQRILDG